MYGFYVLFWPSVLGITIGVLSPTIGLAVSGVFLGVSIWYYQRCRGCHHSGCLWSGFQALKFIFASILTEAAVALSWGFL